MAKGKKKSKIVDLHSIEKKWQKYWEKEKIYKFDPVSNKPVYSIDTPPPTVSGAMHLGHAFSYTHADMIARYKRMKGCNVFYPWGVDDNGLATERLVEKRIGKKAKNFSRKEFIKICLKETKTVEKEMREQFGSLGLSVDWETPYRTIDRWCRKTSQRSFVDIYNQGRTYQKEAPTMWCPTCETAIAQAELEDKERESQFVYIKFDIVGGGSITIATTRPELLPACVAFHVHPEDKRYKHLIGKEVKILFSTRTVKIWANETVDREFGTGAVYHCTFGDLDDVEWIMTYNLPIIEIVGKDGILNEKAGKYKGMGVEKVRRVIIEDLKRDGRIEKIEPIKHVVNVHERCKTPIEIITAKQWFIKYMDLKDEFIARADEIKWFPKYMKVRYDNWVNGLKWDWNISRQRYFGVPFPVWYCKKCGEVKLAEDRQLPVDPLQDKPLTACKCGSREFEPEKDVMDTWATSSLTPQINAGWRDNQKLFKKLYPMSLRPQAHDIITLWAFNTIVKGLLHHRQIPWNDIMISGHALDPEGKKMSKSLGNAIDPIETINMYSADILRYWAGSSTLGEDLPYKEKEFVAGRKFSIKLYNASKFVVSLTSDFNLKTAKEKKLNFKSTDKWILSRLNSVKKEAEKGLENYEYSKALNPTRNFFWLEFADYYIEEVKYRVYNKKDKTRKAAQYTLLKVLLDVLKLMSPFMPHLTEEIYQTMFKKYATKKSIHLEKWPAVEEGLINEYYELLGENTATIISAIRKYKSTKNIALNQKTKKVTIYLKDKSLKNKLEEALDEIKHTMNVKDIELFIKKAPPEAIEVNEEIRLKIEI